MSLLLLTGMLPHSVALARPVGGAESSPLPRFLPGPCPFKPPRGFSSGGNLRCGTLLVAADHTNSKSGVMRLAVAIFRTPSPYRRSDPVVYLSGGPGDGALAMGPYLQASDAPDTMGNHDLILVDQRGTGYSRPRPSCIPADAPNHRSPDTNAAYAGYLKTCHARLERLGANPNLYTTMQSADDIADLRTALNLPPMNLYGVSYGTKLALEIIRRHPTDLRSVVLDSVIPTDFSLSIGGIRAESRGFHALFLGCRRSYHCRRTYPNLKRTFHQLLTRLNHHAARYTSRNKRGQIVGHQVSGNDFAELIRELLYDSSSLPAIPGLIAKVSTGRFDVLAPFFQSTNQYFSGNSPGVYRSVTCAEDIPLDTPAAISAAVATLPNAIKRGALQGEHDQLAECRAWDVPRVDPAFYQPVSSTVPTLLLQGEFDPIAPPANSRRVVATLAHGYRYIFPGIGHGVRFSANCPDLMVNQFFDIPGQAPTSRCIAHMREPF